jgi:hypothetical protein
MRAVLAWKTFRVNGRQGDRAGREEYKKRLGGKVGCEDVGSNSPGFAEFL